MTGRFEGRLAVVTAAASGIGRATATRFALEGARVVAIDFDPRIGEVAAELGTLGDVVGRRLDCTDRAAVEEAFREIQSAGAVDILVNAVGQPTRGNVYSEFYESDPEAWRFVIDVCLTSAMLCSRQVAPAMRERGSGAIVNISSVSWMVPPPPTFTEYAAAKAGIVGFTRAIANELAPHGVRVNAVSPGPVGSAQTDLQPAELKAKVLSSVPLGRYGVPEEIAAGILFLASDDASFITGHNLVIAGGRAMS